MASENVQEFNDQNFESEVLKSDKPVLVDFWAEWCGPCKALAPTIDEVATELGEKAKIGKVDVDSNRETAMKYNISAIPTVILFKDGEVKNQFTGLRSKQEYTDAINSVAG